MRVHTVYAMAAGLMVIGFAQVSAGSPAEGSAVATALLLFRLGRDDYAAGRYADARQKFADSERLDPGPGTMLNLASCDDNLGKTATAWAEYLGGAASARALGRTEWADAAEARAKELEPQLALVKVDVADQGDDVRVLVDEATFPTSLYARATPLDPGRHRLQAIALHKKPREETFEARPGTVVRVTVPLLEPEVALAPPTPSEGRGPPEVPRTSPATSGRGWGPRRTTAVILGGAGVASLLAAGGLALAAWSAYHGANCGSLCGPAGVASQSRAFAEADVASVAAASGAAAVLGGAILWFSNNRRSPEIEIRPVLSPSTAGLALERRW